MKMHQLFFPNGFEKTKVRWEKIKIKLAHNVISLGEVADFGKINFQLKNKYYAKRERE